MYDHLITAISSVGFPIVMCGALGYYILKVEIKTQTAIANLTNAITELKEVIKDEKE